MFEQRGNVFKEYYKIASLHTFITVVITVCTYESWKAGFYSLFFSMSSAVSAVPETKIFIERKFEIQSKGIVCSPQNEWLMEKTGKDYR